MKRLLPILSLCLMSLSCAKDDASDVVVLVSSSANTVSPGGKMYFTVNAWTLHDHLTELDITSFDEITGEQELLHQDLDQKKYSFEYYYTAPELENIRIEMRFSAKDNLGNVGKMKYFINVAGGSPLYEMKSVKMYSPFSGKEDAFSLVQKKAVKSGSSDADFYIYKDSEDPETLAKEWRVNGEIRFCKAEDFKYDSANEAMLTATYKSLNKDTSVSGLKANDIILVGRGEDIALGVIRIDAINDKAGIEEDYYEFSIKVSDD